MIVNLVAGWTISSGYSERLNVETQKSFQVIKNLLNPILTQLIIQMTLQIEWLPLNIKSKVNYIALLHDVVFSFQPK